MLLGLCLSPGIGQDIKTVTFYLLLFLQLVLHISLSSSFWTLIMSKRHCEREHEKRPSLGQIGVMLRLSRRNHLDKLSRAQGRDLGLRWNFDGHWGRGSG